MRHSGEKVLKQVVFLILGTKKPIQIKPIEQYLFYLFLQCFAVRIKILDSYSLLLGGKLKKNV